MQLFCSAAAREALTAPARCDSPPVPVKVTVAEAQQLRTEVQVGVSQEEEEEPEEVRRSLAGKHVLAIPTDPTETVLSMFKTIHSHPPAAPRGAPLSW